MKEHHTLMKFYEWSRSNGIFVAMGECDHGENGHLNPYHLEGSVRIHTLMVYSELDLSGLNQKQKEILEISALCHDIGKIYTREVRPNGNVAFFNHSNASLQDTAEFLYYIGKEDWLDTVLFLVQNHMVPYQEGITYHKIRKLCCENIEYMLLLQRLSEADHRGRIFTKGDLTNVFTNPTD